MKFRPLPVLTVLTLIALGILLWLGNWQYDRFRTKLALEGVEPEWQTMMAPEILDGSALVYSFTDGKAAWRRVVPVRSADEIVFSTIEIIYSVNPPEACGPACQQPVIRPEGLYLTPKGRSVFSGKSDPEKKIFYVYDVDEIAKVLLGAGQIEQVSGKVFEPKDVAVSTGGQARLKRNPFARLGMGDELPPQRHFGYALTWWGLAVSLLAIYFVFHHKQGRLRFRGS